MSDNLDRTLSDNLVSAYVLCDHIINKWSGARVDKEATQDAIANAHAATNAGKFVKNALAGADKEFKETCAAYDAIRTYIYSQTLPYSTTTQGAMKGPRLLSTAKAPKVMVEIERLHDNAKAAKAEFGNVYYARVNQAKAALGLMAKDSDYPAWADVDAAFSFRVDFTPVPDVSDFSRLSVPAELAKQFGESIKSQQEIVMENVLLDIRRNMLKELERISSVLRKYSEKGKGRLYATLVTNIQGIVRTLNDTNFAQNDQISKLTQAIEKHLCQHDVKALKQSPEKCAEVADKAARIFKAAEQIDWF